MIVTVKFLVDRSIFDSEVGTKIENARAGLQKRFSKFGSQPVGQREKDNLGFARELLWIGIEKFEPLRFLVMRQARENLRQGFASKLARSDCNKIDMWMREQQAHHLFAGVTGSAHHCDLCV